MAKETEAIELQPLLGKTENTDYNFTENNQRDKSIGLCSKDFESKIINVHSNPNSNVGETQGSNQLNKESSDGIKFTNSTEPIKHGVPREKVGAAQDSRISYGLGPDYEDDEGTLILTISDPRLIEFIMSPRTSVLKAKYYRIIVLPKNWSPEPSAPCISDTWTRGSAARAPPRQLCDTFRRDDGDILPSAPPLEVLDTVAGYEIVSFDAVSVPPPEPYSDFESIDPGQQMYGTWTPSPEYSLRTIIPNMTEPAVRTALLEYVKGHCCWGMGAATNMTITGIRHNCAYHYVLQTLTEKRDTRWSWSPHVGGDVDGPDSGTAPSAWEIPALPSRPFHTEVKTIEVPHTASIKPCHKCRGSGTLGCPNCHGKGWTRCPSCQGEGIGLGSDARDRCIVCGSSSHGHGRQDCNRCGAKGRVSCSACDSYGQLKCFIQLTVSWKVTVGDHVTGAEDMPSDLLRSAEGQIGLEETGIRLAPLPADIIADETLAMASAQLVNDHIQNSSEALLLAQRHQVRVVPMTGVDYRWKNQCGTYFIYGLDNKIFAPDYPQTCCCGCAIL